MSLAVTLQAGPERPGAALNALMLHGLASDSAVWSAVRDEFPDCRVWTADLPWRGEGVADWQFEPDPVVWLDRTAEAMGEPPQILVAHSFASSLVLDWVCRRSAAAARLRALVLVSPFYRSGSDDFPWEAMEYYVENFHQILAEGIHTRSRRPVDPEIALGMAVHVRDRIGPYAWMRFFHSYMATPFLPLERLDLPCLVLSGRGDRAAFPSDAEALAAALPEAELHVFDDCAHFPMQESATHFAKTVDEFITRRVLAAEPARTDHHASGHGTARTATTAARGATP
ncbi:hypothetical protein GCM10027447_37520 [Glycomyces halotolerans]